MLNHQPGIHGFLLPNATIFNSPIGYGSSWNRDVSYMTDASVFLALRLANNILIQLVRKMAEAIAIEARALGVTQLFAPISDLARELRYGRVTLTSRCLNNCFLPDTAMF